jgi:hypothetical protein
MALQAIDRDESAFDRVLPKRSRKRKRPQFGARAQQRAASSKEGLLR